MGALTINRKRGEDYLKSTASIAAPVDPLFGHISKKPKLLVSMSESASDVPSSSSVFSRLARYPEPQTSLRRDVHAPVPNSRFSSVSLGKNPETSRSFWGSSHERTGNYNALRRVYETSKEAALKVFNFSEKKDGVFADKKKVIEIDNNDSENLGDSSENSSIEEVKIVDTGFRSKLKEGGVVKALEKEMQSLDSSVVTDASNVIRKIEGVEKRLDLMQLNQEQDESEVPYWRRLLQSLKQRDAKLKTLGFDITLKERLLQRYRSLWPLREREEDKKSQALSKECFKPLTEEEKAEVRAALSNSNRGMVLVTHQNSNIDITVEKLKCLSPCAWLNDEVINVYLELLKEREKREPQKFLKCHFFNTFFYKKLISGKGNYNFQSVRRWTTQRKLGYSLADCDKIFVPIHQQIHWCLAIINKKEQKFQYLDSLGGVDSQVLEVLARYYIDEVKDKNGKDIDVSTWQKEFVKDLPEQENGYDCGVFMIKYADFYSRDIGLCFSQENMPYFRVRTAKEILKLRAE